jgi:hypothetical protein
MLYSKRRKNLGGGRRKRSNRKPNISRMRGGTSSQLFTRYQNPAKQISTPAVVQTRDPPIEILHKIVTELTKVIDTTPAKYKQQSYKLLYDVIKKDILDVMGPVNDGELPIEFDFFSNINTVFANLPNGIIKNALYDIANEYPRFPKIIQGKY